MRALASIVTTAEPAVTDAVSVFVTVIVVEVVVVELELALITVALPLIFSEEPAPSTTLSVPLEVARMTLSPETLVLVTLA